jgi:hypothetical protein
MPVQPIQEQSKMDLKEYFANAKGTGILATADTEGKVDLAIYAKPIVVDKDTIALVMREQLSHQNIRANPKTAYIFIEKGGGTRPGILQSYLTT